MTTGYRACGWVLVALAMAACAPGDPKQARPTPDETDTPTVHTPDSDPVPGPTDSLPDDTATPPPLALTGGFVSLSADWLAGGAHPAPIDAGAPAQGDERAMSPQHGAVFPADLDGDGIPEIVVANLGDGIEVSPTAQVFRTDATLSTITWDAALTQVVRQSAPQVPFGLLDVDQDGWDDLYLGSAFGLVRMGSPQGFEAATQVRLTSPTPWTYALGATPADIDQDGLLDLVLSEKDCTGTLYAWHHTGGSHHLLRDLRPAGLTPQQVFASFAYPDPQGRTVLLTQGPTCNESLAPPTGYLRSGTTGSDGWPTFSEVDLSPADAIWRLDPITGGGPYTRAMPMGAHAVDLNGDGILDLLLSLLLDRVVLLRGTDEGAFTEATLPASLNLRGRLGTTSDDLDTPWTIASVDIDQDGLQDLFVATGDDVTTFRVLGGPPYTPAAWRNEGDGTFTEITETLGLDIAGNWRSLSFTDPDGDGDADLFLGGWGVPGRLLRNDVVTGHHGFSLSLRGTTSNSLGVGAKVEVQVGRKPPQHLTMLAGGSEAPLIRPMLFVGLGRADHADLVRIRWPSGVVQELHDLQASQHHVIEEPEVLSLSEPTRHLPIGPSSTLTVTVTPRAPDGSIAVVSAVTASSVGAPGAIGPITGPDPGGRYQFDVTSPAAPGSQVLQVYLDGVPLGVRPRIWWDAP